MLEHWNESLRSPPHDDQTTDVCVPGSDALHTGGMKATKQRLSKQARARMADDERECCRREVVSLGCLPSATYTSTQASTARQRRVFHHYGRVLPFGPVLII